MIPDKETGTARLLFKCAANMGLHPAWVQTGRLFVVATATGEQYVNCARSPHNSHAGASLAWNKYLTRLVLERHNLPNIPYANPKTFAEATDFLAQHKTIITKPLVGSGSENISIIDSATQLKHMEIGEYIFEKYIQGQEIRYLVLNGQVIAVYQSDYGTSVESGRNLRCVSHPANDWDTKLINLSLQITNILGLQFAAVDYLIDSKQQYILEVNTSPDLKWFHAPSDGPPVDVAQMFLQAILPGEPHPEALAQPI